MNIRARGAVITVALAMSAGAAMMAQVIPKPIVSLSTLTPRVATVARDSVDIVVAWTKPVGTTPTRYRVAVTDGDVQRGVIRLGLRDTVRIGKPVCPNASTVRAAIVADYANGTSSTGQAALAIRCRVPTVAEAAQADSYPNADLRIVLATPYVQKMPAVWRDSVRRVQLATTRTFADSATINATWAQIAALPESVAVQQTPGKNAAPFGYRYALCALAKNRYTQRVIVVQNARWTATGPFTVTGSASDAQCERVRAAYEAERAG